MSKRKQLIAAITQYWPELRTEIRRVRAGHRPTIEQAQALFEPMHPEVLETFDGFCKEVIDQAADAQLGPLRWLPIPDAIGLGQTEYHEPMAMLLWTIGRHEICLLICKAAPPRRNFRWLLDNTFMTADAKAGQYDPVLGFLAAGAEHRAQKTPVDFTRAVLMHFVNLQIIEQPTRDAADDQ